MFVRVCVCVVLCQHRPAVADLLRVGLGVSWYVGVNVCVCVFQCFRVCVSAGALQWGRSKGFLRLCVCACVNVCVLIPLSGFALRRLLCQIVFVYKLLKTH